MVLIVFGDHLLKVIPLNLDHLSNNFVPVKDQMLLELHSLFFPFGSSDNFSSSQNVFALNMVYRVLYTLPLHLCLDQVARFPPRILNFLMSFYLFLLEGLDPVVHLLYVQVLLMPGFLSLEVALEGNDGGFAKLSGVLLDECGVYRAVQFTFQDIIVLVMGRY